jgi:hypothetical protein
MHLPGNLLWRGLIMVKNWFINSDDLRLRAGWRIAVFMLLLMALAVAGQMGVRALLGGLPRTSTLVLVIIATAATLAVLIARRYLDRKSFVSFGFNDVRSGSLDMLFGFALSGAMAGLVLWLMVAFGHVTNVQIQWAGLSTALLLLAALLPNLLVGYWEELVFRGYLLQNMREGLQDRHHRFMHSLRDRACRQPERHDALLSNYRVIWFPENLRISRHRHAVAFDRNAYRLELFSEHRVRLCGQRPCREGNAVHA